MSDSNGSSAGMGLWGFGTVIAVTISWSLQESFWYAVGNGILSWIYLIWWGCTH